MFFANMKKLKWSRLIFLLTVLASESLKTCHVSIALKVSQFIKVTTATYLSSHGIFTAVRYFAGRACIIKITVAFVRFRISNEITSRIFPAELLTICQRVGEGGTNLRASWPITIFHDRLCTIRRREKKVFITWFFPPRRLRKSRRGLCRSYLTFETLKD